MTIFVHRPKTIDSPMEKQKHPTKNKNQQFSMIVQFTPWTSSNSKYPWCIFTVFRASYQYHHLIFAMIIIISNTLTQRYVIGVSVKSVFVLITNQRLQNSWSWWNYS